MQKTPLAIGLTVVALTFASMTAGAASAAQLIRYRGPTSQGERVLLEVIKRENGRRLLVTGLAGFTTTCEDGFTDTFGRTFHRDTRLDDSGAFHIETGSRPGSIVGGRLVVDGVVGWGSAEGTLEFRYGSLDEVGDPQLCTTGTVDWQAERRRVSPI